MSSIEFVCDDCSVSFSSNDVAFMIECPFCGSTECYKEDIEVQFLRIKLRRLEKEINKLNGLDKIIESGIDNSVDSVTIDDSAKENMTGEVKDEQE